MFIPWYVKTGKLAHRVDRFLVDIARRSGDGDWSPVTWWRRYVHGGLEIDLRDDWESPKDRPWFFRATRGPAEIVFVLWLPVRDSRYLEFEDWVTAALVDVKRLHAVSAVTSRNVDGLTAVTYTARKGPSASGSTIRETWIGVPDPPGGAVFVFSMTTSSRGVELEDDMMVYEQMIKSVRLDPATLAKYRGVPEGG